MLRYLESLTAPSSSRIDLIQNPVSLKYFHTTSVHQNETFNHVFVVSNNMTAACNTTACMIDFDDSLTPVVTAIEPNKNLLPGDLIEISGSGFSNRTNNFLDCDQKLRPPQLKCIFIINMEGVI